MGRPDARVLTVLVCAAFGTCARGQTISTYAGNGTSGYSGDGGPATAASFAPSLDNTSGVAIDTSGDVYFVDGSNHRVRRVSRRTRVVETVVGDGVPRFAGDGGPARDASLKGPSDLAFDRFGNLYVADAGNHRVRRVAKATGRIETVAGNGSVGFAGDGGPARAASLARPSSIAFGPDGDLFIADTWNSRIRRVDLATRKITTFAGNGIVSFSGEEGPAREASIGGPVHVRFAPSGELLVADAADHVVVGIAPGTTRVRRLAGVGRAGFSGDGGPAAEAALNQPIAVAADRAGNVYVADWINNRVRRVDATTHVVSTVAGDGRTDPHGVAFFAGDGGPATAATLGSPASCTVDRAGNLFVVDALNARLRVVRLAAPVAVRIPLVASTSGLGGAFYRSDLTLVSRSARPTRVRLRFRGSGGLAWKALRLGAGEALHVADVLGLVAPPPEVGTIGTLTVFFDDVTDSALVSAASRVARVSADDPRAAPLGPLLQGVRADAVSDDTLWIPGLREGGGVRSDLALVHAGGGNAEPIEVSVELFDAASGEPAGAPVDVELSAGEYRPLGGLLGARGLVRALARVTRRSGADDLLAFGTVVDERTSDGVVLSPVDAEPGESLLPVVVDGGAPVRYRTALVLANPRRETVVGTLTFTPAPGLSGAGSFTVAVPPRREVAVEDVRALLSREGLAVPATGTLVGSLRVTGLAAWARVDAGGGEPFGLGIPAVPEEGWARRVAFVDGLRQDAETRGHVAVVNAERDESARPFVVTAYDGATGRAVRTETLVLRGGEWAQLSALLAPTEATLGWARVASPSGARFVAYGVLNGEAPSAGAAGASYLPMVSAE